jgi:hypothetical protein
LVFLLGLPGGGKIVGIFGTTRGGKGEPELGIGKMDGSCTLMLGKPTGGGTNRFTSKTLSCKFLASSSWV